MFVCRYIRTYVHISQLISPEYALLRMSSYSHLILIIEQFSSHYRIVNFSLSVDFDDQIAS